MIDRAARKTTVKAKALTSPKPRRVSLCKAGANQSPIVKHKASSIGVQNEEVAPMLNSMKAQGFVLAGITFKGTEWTRPKVDAWMAEGGYTGFSVDGSDGDYTVKSDNAIEGESRTITTSGGLAVTLTKAPTEDVAKDVGDGGSGFVDNAEGAASDVQPVAKAAEDLIARCKAAIIPEARAKSLYTVSQFSDLIRSLSWLVSEMSWDDMYGKDGDPSDDGLAIGTADSATRESLIGELKAIGTQLLAAFAALVNIEVSEFGAAFKSAKETPAMTDTTKSGEPGTATIVDTPVEQVAPAVTEAPAAAPAGDGGEAAAVETPAAAPAAAEGVEPGKLEEIKEVVEAVVEGAVEGVIEGAEAAAAAAEKTADGMEGAPAWAVALATKFTASVETLTERVKAVETGVPVEATKSAPATAVPARKSEATEEQPSSSTPTEATKAASDFGRRRFKAALGL